MGAARRRRESGRRSVQFMAVPDVIRLDEALHVWHFGLSEHSGEIAGKINVRPLFPQFEFFCLVGSR